MNTVTFNIDGVSQQFKIDNDCTDCQEALSQLSIETNRPIRTCDSRVPIMLLRDPDYPHIMHMESLDMPIAKLRHVLRRAD